jgi:imidazolonepropionase-like amidohydrolase
MNFKSLSGATFLFVSFVFFANFISAQTIAIKAGKLVDPETGTTATNQIILVENRRIKSVGAGLQIPAGATVIDLSNSTVLPGLFDAHAHMCLTTPPENRDQQHFSLFQTTSFRALLGVQHSREILDAGFTTIRDIGNAGNYADTALRLAIEQGIVPGPTIVNAGRIIAPFGGQQRVTPEQRGLAEPEYFFADTRDEMRKAIRENVHFGALVIKIVVDDQRYIYPADDIKFMVEEAKNAGVKIAAHCLTERGARNAAEAGVASIEHGLIMSDETLQLAKRNNVVLVGTEFTEENARHLGLQPDSAKQFHDLFVDRLKRAYKIGVPMAFGSDVVFTVKGETRGTLTINTINSFTEAGIPAKDILRYMTTDAARLLDMQTRRGSIKAGYLADIIATPENPLDNINALKKVSFVMKNGSVFKQAK